MTIPEDIEATAKKLVEFWLPPRDVRDAAIDSFDMDGLTNSVKEIIARAILAERQRCADVAIQHFKGYEYNCAQRAAGATIYAAILAGEAA
ncbi:hypothetical protein F9K97_05685 [Brucella anthropi]|uniref:hypothetical protein n=1 Tax=Brucella anthropi TaxID=529 RepID=UPI00124F699A|nr:hypothetical protein [Brucella anthropi]KAB2788570.1 hypothetical protein F9K97_05685 [Brucella anthropi]